MTELMQRGALIGEKDYVSEVQPNCTVCVHVHTCILYYKHCDYFLIKHTCIQTWVQILEYLYLVIFIHFVSIYIYLYLHFRFPKSGVFVFEIDMLV